MKITTLKINDFKRIHAVEMKFEANGLTVIGGKNGQGKTSTLDALAFGLGGGRHAPTNARNSEADPYIRIETSNGLIVERKGKNSALKVSDEKGMRGGQTLLDDFLCELALDLPRFLSSSEKEKVEILMSSLGIKDALEEIEDRYQDAYADRRVTKRDLKAVQSIYESMERHADVPDEEVDVGELTRKLNELNEENSRRTQVAADLKRAEGMKSSNLIAIEELEKKIKSIREDNVTIDSEIARLKGIDVQPLDTSEISEQLESAGDINAMVRANADYRAKAKEISDLTEQVESIESNLTALSDEKRKLLIDSKIPIEGLDVEQGSITYKGQHWDGMSGSEQLIVAVSIIKSIKPECQFILMDKLEQMDAETLAEFSAWVVEQGLQVIATRVSLGDECSFIIEDGNLLEAEAAV